MDAAHQENQAARRPGKSAGSTDQPMRITVLGATGSIGKSTLDLIRRNPDRFSIVAVVAHSKAVELADLARAVDADCAVCADEASGLALSSALSGSGIATGAGETAVLEAVDRPVDMVVGGIVGSAGLKPTLAALKPGRILALANKECLVSAGDLFMRTAEDMGVRILPVDSEHNAIFQVFEADNASEVEKVILTASGGPFRTLSLAEMEQVTPAQALKHPNWEMGRRITIDSATLMNKGFEVIEAFHLFPIRRDQLGVLVHPQSIVHGLVQYTDGSLLAQLGAPDMRTPIARCLAWPERMSAPVERLDLGKIANLTFETPDLGRFPALKLAMDALDHGSVATAALNAADEIAVEAFLTGRIAFLDIARLVGETVDAVLQQHGGVRFAGVDDVLAVDAHARALAVEWTERRAS